MLRYYTKIVEENRACDESAFSQTLQKTTNDFLLLQSKLSQTPPLRSFLPPDLRNIPPVRMHTLNNILLTGILSCPPRQPTGKGPQHAQSLLLLLVKFALVTCPWNGACELVLVEVAKGFAIAVCAGETVCGALVVGQAVAAAGLVVGLECETHFSFSLVLAGRR